MRGAVQDYKNSEKTLKSLEDDLRSEYKSATCIDIKRKALYHCKGQQERLKYTGGKYLNITLFIAIMTLFANIVLKLFISSPTVLWVIFSIITSGVILISYLVDLQHGQAENGIYQATTMIELLENQIEELHSDNNEDKKESPADIKQKPSGQ
ncbi:hypothetical protein GZ22_18605 (plasmid) [Terribacillus saccharophilus]|uniref:Uncharacterized protein n=1 Tax=Terribacillus saccharophilus TaxID=361277 RepID=A0A075LNZ8_9BACI|nr:hypothetical protein [Terribacillus goriensis]AIF68435.1 hypothetical protein GZ22_18605 [Terribacillus goriensis]